MGLPYTSMRVSSRQLMLSVCAAALGTAGVLVACGGDDGVATSAQPDASAVQGPDTGTDGQSPLDAEVTDATTLLDASALDAGDALADAIAPDGAVITDAGPTDAALEAEAEASAPVDAGPPAVRFVGRFDRRSPAAPKAAWPGARIVARFSGPEVKVRLDEQYFAWMSGAPSEWDVIVDGLAQSKLVVTAGPKDYLLAQGLPAGPHTVELFKRSEAQNGNTQFLGFTFPGGTLLPPPPLQNRRIEVVGDSSASGYGIEPADNCTGGGGAAKYQNFRKAWPSVFGAAVNAEVHGVVYSGKGLTRNIWRPDTEPIPKLFPRTNPLDTSLAHNFGSWTPDLVAVMLGANDFADGLGSPNLGPATYTAFVAEYKTFVGTLRTNYPGALLVLAVSPTAVDGQAGAGAFTRTNIRNAIKEVIQARASLPVPDTNVVLFAPAIAPNEELTACDGHGNTLFHNRVAAELAALVKPRLNW